jgi:hypothetical protein
MQLFDTSYTYFDIFLILFLTFKKSNYFCAIFKHKIINFYKETEIIFNITY